MGKSLADIMAEVQGEQTKVASANNDDAALEAEIMKIASECGIIEAESQDNKNNSSEQSSEGQTKEANVSLESLFNQMQGAGVSGQEKTAAEQGMDKIAEAQGALAHDYAVENYELGCLKIAAALVEEHGDHNVSDVENDEDHHGNTEITGNQDDVMKNKKAEGQIGHVEAMKTAALQKHLLLASAQEE